MEEAEETERALRRVAEVVAALSEEGFVLTGEIVAIKPRVRDLVAPVADLHLGPMARLVLRTEKVEGATNPLVGEIVEAEVSSLITNQLVKYAGLSADLPITNPRELGYTGNACTCGSMRMVRRGSCEYCQDCGSSSGCS